MTFSIGLLEQLQGGKSLSLVFPILQQESGSVEGAGVTTIFILDISLLYK